MEENNINKSDDKNHTKKMKDAEIDKDVKKKEDKGQIPPEEKIKELEDKLARAYAEMENQRRRYEKEKDD